MRTSRSVKLTPAGIVFLERARRGSSDDAGRGEKGFLRGGAAERFVCVLLSTAGKLAFEKPMSLCEEHGFRPHIVQEASYWLTILSLGVTIAPACVQKIASSDVVC
jgi:hypothetical protein